jgi:hypothetical protein
MIVGNFAFASMVRSFVRIGATLAAIAVVAVPSVCSAAGWRGLRIDGSTPAAFERSVGSLQERLTKRRRAKLEAALAIIWFRQTSADAGDTNSDGLVDVVEVRELHRTADDVLTDIRRGVFMSTTAARDAGAADYIEQLGGLAYHDVIDLAAATPGDVFLTAMRREADRVRCSGLRKRAGSEHMLTDDRLKSSFTSRYCARR